MERPHVIIPGIVQNGVVVPVEKNWLPEGAQVEIVVPTLQFPPELQAEFEDWERLSTESWSKFLAWEKEELTKEDSQ